MRVYHLIKGLGRGGAEMLLPEGLREASPGVEAAVGYFLPHKDALVGALREQGVPVTCFGARSNRAVLAQVPHVARELRRWRADVVHCHLPLSGVVGRLAGRLVGVPVVYTEHNLQPRYHRATFLANRLTWRWQDRVIACSEDVARSIQEHLGDRTPVVVVQNGVSTNRFRRDPEAGAALRRQLGIPPEGRVMVTVAVFRTQKRLPVWLQVARAVLDGDPRAYFLLVGDGPLRAEVEAEIARLGLEERVKMPGLVEDVRPWLSAADLYVIASAFEGLPVAMLEAMACSLPVVSTDVGGIREVVRDGHEGQLVPRDAPMGLVTAVLAFFADDALRERCGTQARARVEERFGMRRMMGEIEAVYREVLR